MANEQLSIIDALKVARDNLCQVSVSGYANMRCMARGLELIIQVIAVLDEAKQQSSDASEPESDQESSETKPVSKSKPRPTK